MIEKAYWEGVVTKLITKNKANLAVQAIANNIGILDCEYNSWLMYSTTINLITREGATEKFKSFFYLFILFITSKLRSAKGIPFCISVQ